VKDKLKMENGVVQPSAACYGLAGGLAQLFHESGERTLAHIRGRGRERGRGGFEDDVEHE
jgi:hypothetical protein